MNLEAIVLRHAGVEYVCPTIEHAVQLGARLTGDTIVRQRETWRARAVAILRALRDHADGLVSGALADLLRLPSARALSSIPSMLAVELRLYGLALGEVLRLEPAGRAGSRWIAGPQVDRALAILSGQEVAPA